MLYIIIFIIIFLLFLCKRVYRFIPGTYISVEEFPIISKIKLKQNELNTTRLFNVFNTCDYLKLNEVFEHEYTEWITDENKNLTYICETEIFENFNCYFHKKIPFEKTIPQKTLMYFPFNNVTWKTDNYIYDKKEDQYYFLKPNSLIFSKNELEWCGDKNINIVIGYNKK
jgi:hypothetical protein